MENEKWPTLVFFPEKSHGQKSLAGYSPWSLKESGTTEQLSTASELFGFPGCTSGKEPACQCRRCRFNPWVMKIPWKGKWPPTPVFLPRKSHRQRSLQGYSPRGCKRVRQDSD